MKLKTKLGFIYRGFIGIFNNIFDNPKIDKKIDSLSLGKTVLGNDIRCFKFGNGGRKVLYFGGIHGNEIGTVRLMNRWINYIYKNNDIIKNSTAYIIPCLNIDGYNESIKNPDYFNGGTIGKTNARNVDLNRNFPTKNWSKESKIFISGKYDSISGGEKAASEPEIKSLLEFINKENISIVYTFHNCWATVFSLNSINNLYNYSRLSGYRVFSKKERDSLKEQQKTGHSMLWGLENNIEIIEVELKYRYGSERKRNKRALIDSLD